ncbi:50S ribosomal protein L10 [Helicobacter mustelae]|uniref:Large ribosomal subunit protein uL10 n=1 Tax=Helicobacter mustelae (strain ATCC 43772 / CCUG 25715 / CIP 103759 / LMG 18044 / NCTC 12198 / R85-136P) TaxID=679897 RepID=D3UGF8_HELM1|nr:50S ribosomal protein L10 [Helicobacter mustelae]CBG39579.1 50S ribosomal protein L10 [Helicobacter mustelae 12198]SQH71091.1 50S ribosomal protein L10 [Helicobacter mustelae]STP12220.1 50S ribosomal protein L10 [Helicobacter mustelae]
MTKQDKKLLVESLSADFRASNSLIVCDYKGLSVAKLEALRKAARDADAKVQVIKNTLAKIALKDAGYPDFELKDTNIFIWSNEQISLSKFVIKFADEHKDFFRAKVGCFDGEVVDVNHITSISKLPSRDELIGMLLSVWMGPARYFVTALDNLKKQKESE